MELLFDAYTDHADIANKWRKLYHMQESLWTSDCNERDKRAEERRQDIKRLQDELHKANYTIKTLKKKLRTK
jgi:predicted RNase H-like nuclease (RuvC/YqgF family)